MNDPKTQLINYRLERARESLNESRVLYNEKHWNASVSRLYYACFYAVTALLFSRGLVSSKHSGIRSLFGLHFVKTELISKELGAFYNDIFECRQESDYEDFFHAEPNMVNSWISQAENFINIITDLIHSPPKIIDQRNR